MKKKEEIVDNFNYLGIVFNYTGTFILNQKTLAGKGLKALKILMHNIKGLNLKPCVTCQLFDAFATATLNYGCEIRGFSRSKDIERIHLTFCKMLLTVKSCCTNMSVYGEFWRYPFYIKDPVCFVIDIVTVCIIYLCVYLRSPPESPYGRPCVYHTLAKYYICI
jgi:hypothetical protein